MNVKVIVNGSLKNGIVCRDTKTVMHKGTPKANPPSSYKMIGMLHHNIGNLYNLHYMNIYEAKDKTLRYEIYRDGSFYPYYGKIEIEFRMEVGK